MTLLETLRRFPIMLGLVLLGCGGADDTGSVAVPDRPGVTKTAASVRAERRLFDGAPPVIPHQPLGAACTSCHNEEGVAVPDLGYAPPSPHAAFGGQTAGMSAISRCRQCHVFQRSDDVFVANDWRGLEQDLRRGRRLNALAPPVIPHKVFMREACLACHGGPAAREAIRTSHPERARCRQCHLEQRIAEPFDRSSEQASLSTHDRSAP